MPQIADYDEAFYSRFRVLRYNHTLPQNEWIKDIDRIILELELGYVLRFAIEGLKSYIVNGMELSHKGDSDSYVYEAKLNENSFVDFASQFICVSEDGIVMNSALYEAYYDYFGRNKLVIVSDDRFCKKTPVENYNAIYCRFGKYRDRGYRGIKLCYDTDNN